MRFFATPPFALTASAAIHAAAVLMVGGHGVSGPSTGTVQRERTVDVEPMLVEEAPVADPPLRESKSFGLSATAPPHGPQTHVHPYPVPKNHDARPHAPSLVHTVAPPEPGAVAAAPVVQVAPEAPARFVLTVGSTFAHRGGPTSAEAHPGTGVGQETVSEAGVSVPARLLQTVAAQYPPEARAAEVETDVPVEIVVDTRGVVVEARALTHAGYGLDEAATRTVRAYRFSPAVRDGRPVRVRMRWTVLFRLR